MRAPAPPFPRGRGSGSNPGNRFEKLEIAADGDALDAELAEGAERRAPTELLTDRSRSIIARNDSPDVGFETSVNPYRGCSHGCTYCMAGETPILMGDGTTRRLDDLRVGDEIYGTLSHGPTRRFTRTKVLAHWQTVKPAYAITLADGTRLVASGDHRFLTERGWKHVTNSERGPDRAHLTVNDSLLGIGALAVSPELDVDSRRGYPSGRIRGIEPLGDERPLFDITTGTGDFIADGVVSHNCYARPFHEYLGFSAGLDFETKILVKPEAPELLRKELMAPSWQPQLVVMSGVTDCYQPAERRLRITRRCLEVLAELRNPTAVIPKTRLVTRDIDLLGELARHRAAAVTLSITTLDPELARRMEPRASSPRDRLAAVSELAAAGIPVGVNVAPVIPALTDHELPAILAAAKAAGAAWAKYLIVRLPFAVKDLFQEWLDEHFPERKEKVLARLRDLREGRLNDPRFGKRHTGEGPFADQIRLLYETSCRRLDLPSSGPELSTESFRRPGQQLGLFG